MSPEAEIRQAKSSAIGFSLRRPDIVPPHLQDAITIFQASDSTFAKRVINWISQEFNLGEHLPNGPLRVSAMLDKQTVEQDVQIPFEMMDKVIARTKTMLIEETFMDDPAISHCENHESKRESRRKNKKLKHSTAL